MPTSVSSSANIRVVLTYEFRLVYHRSQNDFWTAYALIEGSSGKLWPRRAKTGYIHRRTCSQTCHGAKTPRDKAQVRHDLCRSPEQGQGW